MRLMRWESSSERISYIPLHTISDKLTNFPKKKGPGVNDSLQRKRAAIGIEYAVFCPATPKENTAVIAAGPANASKPSMSETKAAIHTPVTGVFVYGLIRYMYLESGKPPSLEKAKVWREEARS